MAQATYAREPSRVERGAQGGNRDCGEDGRTGQLESIYSQADSLRSEIIGALE